MTKLPVVTPRQLIRALERAGFFIRRTTGSHYILNHRTDPRRSVVVPHHPGDLKTGTLRAILRQADLSADQLIDLL